ncbi:DoxX family membrane protein [Saccharothrix sp.]|uniref:DoxX family membrane protein n=1 Tax=Saccharothrix sp. TaxID=1873460 RepID=UPI002811BA5C|nr:DoxX family membrane protein [Saccharothrix sp.]
MVEGIPRPGLAGLRVLDTVSVPLLRGSLGVVFVWFGALKVAGTTPVADLVAGTVPWPAPGVLVAGLGAVEVLLGGALVAGRFLRPAAVLVMVHLGGTFLTLVVQPAVAFRAGNPLVLTLTGEFVVKNLVLFTAALVVLCADLRRGGVR